MGDHTPTQLIAAAPEMLAILKITRGNISSLCAAHPAKETPYDVWLAEVDRVIALAEGEYP